MPVPRSGIPFLHPSCRYLVHHALGDRAVHYAEFGPGRSNYWHSYHSYCIGLLQDRVVDGMALSVLRLGYRAGN